MRSNKDDLESQNETLKEELDTISEKKESLEKGQQTERRKIEKAATRDGKFWLDKVPDHAPEFKILEPGERTVPIISVLNLKGGVGKTTITANLGSVMDTHGARVLMMDMDLQGSLTNLFFLC